MPRRIEKIREAGVNELEAQQKELTETIFRLRFQLSTGQAEARPVAARAPAAPALGSDREAKWAAGGRCPAGSRPR